MKATYVDAEGNVCCPVCGAKDSFAVKRTTKAKWTAALIIGDGGLAMSKRLNCNGCGTNLMRGGAIAPAKPRQPSAQLEQPDQRPSTPLSRRIHNYYDQA
jgi:phage/plasmid primase-like uncharacterized protein